MPKSANLIIIRTYPISSSNMSKSGKNGKLPVITIISRYIEVHKYLRIAYPTYFRLAILLQPSPCLHSYSFMRFLVDKDDLDRIPPAIFSHSKLPQLK
jgi:hypothetical protein